MPKGNPQLEDGYTPIANELLEAFLQSDLSRQELKIVGAIFRQTYGWRRKEAEISITVFQKLTNLHRRHVQRAIMSLIEKNLISRSTGAEMKYGKAVYKYQISKKDCSQYGYSQTAEKRKTTVANTATEAVANTAPIKTIKTNDNTSYYQEPDEKKELHKQITEIFSLFRKVNPMIHYGHTTNRKSIEKMIKKFGFKKLKATVEYSNSIQGKQYAPTITTPYLLLTKLGELLIYYKKEKSPKKGGITIL